MIKVWINHDQVAEFPTATKWNVVEPPEPPDSHAIARIYRNHPEYEENAHLIAAAPAMYEALKFLTSEIDLSKLNVRKDFSLMNAHAWAVKVILQAEGKLL